MSFNNLYAKILCACISMLLLSSCTTATGTLAPSPAASNTVDLLTFLIADKEIPPGFSRNLIAQGFDDNNQLYAETQLTNSKSPKSLGLMSRITVSSKKVTRLPVYPKMKPIQTENIGTASQVYTGRLPGTLSITADFYKGNSLITLSFLGTEDASEIKQLVDLAKLIDSRLPDSFQGIAPISFPSENSREDISGSYFTRIEIGNLDANGRNILSKSSFTASERVCTLTEALPELNQYSIAIYDLKAAKYTAKSTLFLKPGVSAGCQSFKPGSYLFNIAVNDRIVKSLPFEVK